MFHGLLKFATATCLVLSANAARYPSFGTLQTTNSSGVLNVVINNTFSPINLFDFHVAADLANLIETLQANDTDIRVVVFSSGNKDFFIAHFDINFVLPGYESPIPAFDPAMPNMTFALSLLWNITQLPQATIAAIEGRARGIGNEFIMACDMRFATTAPSVLLGQIETSLGVIPGAGGGLYLAHEIGRGRALEYVLSAQDIDGATAERIGWINRAFPTSSALADYVQTLAARIALFPPAGIAAAKREVDADVFDVLVGTPAAQALEEKFIALTHNQSIGPLELSYGTEVFQLYK
ncbi:ClpP/crotonase-like domain-containing protein [Mycena olivaceomarginata]|nr:ClpP/crotonase-like domain-containing protein [Mycena olivaceomarginata]